MTNLLAGNGYYYNKNCLLMAQEGKEAKWDVAKITV